MLQRISNVITEKLFCQGQNMNTQILSNSIKGFPSLRSCSCKFCTYGPTYLLSKILQLPRCTSKLPKCSFSTCLDRGLQHPVPRPTNPSGYLEDGEETSVSFTVGQQHATALRPQGDGRPIFVVTIDASKPW